MPQEYFFSITSGGDHSFSQGVRYALVLITESSGRGFIKLSLLTVNGEIVIKASSDNHSNAISLSLVSGMVKLANNDSITLGGKMIILEKY